MTRLRAGLAVAVLLIAAGCGGSGSDSPEAKATTTGPKLLTTGQACAQVQMVNDQLHGPGRWAIPTYGEFGTDTAPLADQSVPEIADALKSMSDQAVKVGSMSGDDDTVTDEAAEWATRYQAVADICARTDSPIGRLP